MSIPSSHTDEMSGSSLSVPKRQTNSNASLSEVKIDFNDSTTSSTLNEAETSSEYARSEPSKPVSNRKSNSNASLSDVNVEFPESTLSSKKSHLDQVSLVSKTASGSNASLSDVKIEITEGVPTPFKQISTEAPLPPRPNKTTMESTTSTTRPQAPPRGNTLKTDSSASLSEVNVEFPDSRAGSQCDDIDTTGQSGDGYQADMEFTDQSDKHLHSRVADLRSRVEGLQARVEGVDLSDESAHAKGEDVDNLDQSPEKERKTDQESQIGGVSDQTQKAVTSKVSGMGGGSGSGLAGYKPSFVSLSPGGQSGTSGELTRNTTTTTATSPNSSASDDAYARVAAELALELVEGGREAACKVALNLKRALGGSPPASVAQLAHELTRNCQMAARLAGSSDTLALPLVACVVSELAARWSPVDEAMFLDILAGGVNPATWAPPGGIARWTGRRQLSEEGCLDVSDFPAAELMMAVAVERGLVLASVEWVEWAADLAAELATPPQCWTEGQVAGLVRVLLPQAEWDLVGLARLSPAGGCALLAAALRSASWTRDRTAVVLRPLVPDWEGVRGAGLCVELVGSFGWSVAEVADLTRLLIGWEAASVETAAGLAVRLVGGKFGWLVPDVADLLISLREEEAEAGEWAPSDLGSLVDCLYTTNWEFETILELLECFPMAWDVEMASDLIGSLEWPPEDMAQLLSSVISLERREPLEVVQFLDGLRSSHGWSVGEIVDVFTRTLSETSPYFGGSNLVICADLSSALEALAWDPDEIFELVSGLGEASVGTPRMGNREEE